MNGPCAICGPLFMLAMAGFFEKIIDEGNDVTIPEFLSDHPDSAARVREINGLASDMGCSHELMDVVKWRAFQKIVAQ